MCLLLVHQLLQAGQVAAAEGAAGLVLHARTADQQYSPPSHWDAVAQLVAAVPDSVPVVGNGDVFEAADAVQMMRQTGCKGERISCWCSLREGSHSAMLALAGRRKSQRGHWWSHSLSRLWCPVP